MKELKVVPPEGYEIDQENSTLECIKFKKKNVRWRGNGEALVNGCYIDNVSDITTVEGASNIEENYNVFATEAQAKSALAMARISQIMANDKRFGGVVTDEEWKSHIRIYSIACCGDEIKIITGALTAVRHYLSFHTLSQCKLFLKENLDLIRDYLMLSDSEYEVNEDDDDDDDEYEVDDEDDDEDDDE